MTEEIVHWKVIGYLKYHIYEVKFEGKEDETQYRVTCCQKDLRTINEPIEQIEDVQVYAYEDIGSARGVFQNAVNYCMYATSSSDVSLAQSRINIS